MANLGEPSSQAAVGIAGAEVGVVLTVDEQDAIEMVQREAGLFEVHGYRRYVASDDALSEAPGFDKDKTESFQQRSADGHLGDGIHVGDAVLDDAVGVVGVVFAVEADEITYVDGDGQIMGGGELLQTFGVLLFLRATAAQRNDEMEIPGEAIFLAEFFLLSEVVEQAEQIDGFLDVLAWNGAYGVEEYARVGGDSLLLDQEPAQVLAGLVEASQGIVDAVGYVPHPVSIDAVFEQPIIIGGIDGDVFDIGGAGIQYLVPIGHLARQEALKLLDVVEIARTLLGKIMHPHEKAFSATCLILGLSPEIKSIDQGGIDAHRKVFHQDDIGVGELILELVSYVGSVPDIVVDALGLHAFAFQAGDRIVRGHLGDVAVAELAVMPRQESADSRVLFAEESDS